MKWYTHAVVGANAAWLVQWANAVDERVTLFVVVGAFAALLPDIDAVSAKIHYIGGGALGMFRGERVGVFQHRGLWHSIFMTVVVLVVSLVFLWQVHPLLPFVIALGYFSHPLIDTLNSSVGFLFPFYNKRINIVPRFLRSKVGGPVDTILFIIAAAALFVFLLGNIQNIVDFESVMPA